MVEIFQAQLKRMGPFIMGLAPVLLHGLLAEKEDIEKMQEVLNDPTNPTVESGMKLRGTEELKRRICDIAQDLSDRGWF
jgi:hypothetical protein